MEMKVIGATREVLSDEKIELKALEAERLIDQIISDESLSAEEKKEQLALLARVFIKKSYGKPSLNELLTFCGHEAGICYMKDDFETILNESKEATETRIESTAANGHHSVYDHVYINFEMKLPKLFAMLLNNEHNYTTSEKSARYTYMDGGGTPLYDKWIAILREAFIDKLGISIPLDKETLDEKEAKKLKRALSKAEKLAMENARYFFTCNDTNYNGAFCIVKKIKLFIWLGRKLFTRRW